ncbi:hypothetical protein ACOMHN_028891 [Nucella lapillus]
METPLTFIQACGEPVVLQRPCDVYCPLSLLASCRPCDVYCPLSLLVTCRPCDVYCPLSLLVTCRPCDVLLPSFSAGHMAPPQPECSLLDCDDATESKVICSPLLPS